MASLGVALVSTDGELDREEVRTIRQLISQRYEFDEHGVRSLKKSLKQASFFLPTLPDIVRMTQNALSNKSPQFIEQFIPEMLGFLYQVAMADGKIQAGEEAFIEQLCHSLGISQNLRKEIRLEYTGDVDLAPYFKVLELHETATWAEVKKAYRSQTVEYHPDKMMSMPPKIRAFAQEEQRRLNEAYEILRKYMEGK